MESGTFNSTGGRKPRIIQCVPDVRLALGMDITAHHLNLVLTDLMGTVLANQRLQLKYENTDRYYEQVREQLEAFVFRSGVQEERILGVGISLPASSFGLVTAVIAVLTTAVGILCKWVKGL